MARSGQCNLTTGRIATAHWYSPCRLRQCAPPSNTWSLGSTRVQNPNPKRRLDRISRFCTAHCIVSLYFTMIRPFPLKIGPCDVGSGPPSNTWFLGPTPVLNPNGISIRSAVLQGSLLWHTDRRTNHATRSVTIGRIYVYVVLRCGLII